MIRVTVEIDCPAGQSIGVKESIAMLLERFGDTRVTAVEIVPDRQPEQITLFVGGKMP